MVKALRYFGVLAAGCCALLFAPRAAAQTLTETFAGGFTPALGWSGDLLAFRGEGGRLVLRDTRATPSATARVSVPAPTREAACWTLDVEQKFSPSTSNRVRWWLAADKPLESTTARGFYFQFGGISGNDDALELFYTNGTSAELVAGGRAGVAATDLLAVSVKVCAAADRRWTWSARTLAGAVVDTGAGVAPVALAGQYAGFEVAFTSTRNGLLSFDDLRIQPLFADRTAPTLVLAKADNATTITLVASEALGAGAANVANYSVGGRAPASVLPKGDTIRLTLSQNLPSGVATEVRITGWQDLAGNVAPPIMTSVTYTAPRTLATYDVLITELMADPTPVVGLPDAEYVELYNAGAAPVNLADLTLRSGRTDARLPAITLAPKAYVALTKVEVADPRYTVFAGVPTLTNGGGTMTLLSGATVVDEVTYSDSYYTTGKRDGGYSLERIDLAQPCIVGGRNFAASNAIAGGTPGTVNSVNGSVEVRPLRISGARLIDPSTIEVTTNRRLTAPAPTAFVLSDNGLGAVTSTELAGTYRLALATALLPGEVLSLTLSPGAASCSVGEQVGADTLYLGIPETAEPGDWDINEIMYDPLTGEGRWVELVNRSSKLLTLEGLQLARAFADGSVDQAFSNVEEVLVPGGGYLVVAADPETLRTRFPEARPSAVAKATVPTLGDRGCLVLQDPVTEQRYFLVCYDKSWHNRAFAKTDGVSLERIDLDAATQDGNNWTSASSTSGFGTPTLPNSQARAASNDGRTRFSLPSERISPDGDGFEDLLRVDFNFTEPGVLLRFSVIDLQGRAIYAPNEDIAPGLTGSWSWDGVTDDGEVVRVGTYVLRAEYFSPDMAAKREFLGFSVLERQ